MTERQFRVLISLSFAAGLATLVVLAVALAGVKTDGQKLSRQIVAAQVAGCLGNAKPAVAQLNFDYGVFHADFAAAHDPTVSAAERSNRLAEARFLLAQSEIRADRVDVSALRFAGKHRLIDPALRAVVRRVDFHCVAQYP